MSISKELKMKARELRKFCQFLSTFYPEFKRVSRTTHFNAQNDHNQISRELVSVRDMAKDAGVGSKTSSTTKSAKNWSASGTWLRMLRFVAMVMMVMMKWSKDHLFPRSQTDLQGILSPYALEKEFVGTTN